MPFEIPENWCWVEMSDIFLLNPKNDINDNVEGGFIPMACVCDGYSGEHTFITKQWGNIKKGFSHFQNGDIGIAKISPCFENRKSVIFSNLPNNIGSGTTELVILRGILVNTAFYLLLFKSDWYISEGTKYFKGVVGQQRVHKDIFTTLQVPMPPLREQQKIVDSVKKWFSVIDEIENGATELETVIKQTKSKILDLAISGKLVSQDPNDEPAIELLKRINPGFKPCDNSHYENLPESWEEIAMGEICKLYDGEKVSGPSLTYIDVKYLRGSKVGEFVTSGKYVPQGSTLILVDGENSGEVFTTPIDGYQGSTFKILGITEYLDKEYVLLLIKRSQKLLRENKVGSAIPHLNKKMFKELIVPVPPLAEQKRIVATVNMLFYKLDMITAEL